ncbi:hypothetical protein CF327_g7614, partial [Tilletia walkeri]
HLVLPDAAPYPLSSSKQQSLARSSYTYTRSTYAHIHMHGQHTPSTSFHTYQEHTDNLQLQDHSQESTNSTVNFIETRGRHRPCLATELSAARMLSASPSSQLPPVTTQLRSRNYLSSTCTSHNREETLPDKIRPSSPHARAWTSGRTLYDQEPRCSSRYPSSFLPHTPASLKKAPVRNSHDREGTMPDNIRRPSSSHTYALTSGRTLTTRNQEQDTQASRLTHTHLTTYNHSLATIHRIHIHDSQQ